MLKWGRWEEGSVTRGLSCLGATIGTGRSPCFQAWGMYLGVKECFSWQTHLFPFYSPPVWNPTARSHSSWFPLAMPPHRRLQVCAPDTGKLHRHPLAWASWAPGISQSLTLATFTKTWMAGELEYYGLMVCAECWGH